MTDPTAAPEPVRSRRRLPLYIGVAIIVLLVGASIGWLASSRSSDAAAASSTPAMTSTAAGAGSCAQLVRDGATVTDDLVDRGCSDSNGSVRMGTHKVCKSGRRLWKMNGYVGLSGGPMITETSKVDGLAAGPTYDYLCTTATK